MSDPDPLPQWDVPQEFTEVGSHTVRGELEEYVRRDLLGPWEGPLECLGKNARGPIDRYLVGRLGPRKDFNTVLAAADMDATDTNSGGDSDASDPEPLEQLTIQNAGRMYPSSMGLSFTVPADVDALHVEASWGRYTKATELDDDGKSSTLWSREPVSKPCEVRLDGKASDRFVLYGDKDNGVDLQADVRFCEGPDGSPQRIVEIALINNQPEPGGMSKDTASLFQAELTVTALDGVSPVFLPIDDPLDKLTVPGTEFEERHLDLLYRNTRKYADGRNIAVHADTGQPGTGGIDSDAAVAESAAGDVDPGYRRAWRLTTTWVPYFDVPSTTAPSPADTPYLAGLELSMDLLAELDPAALAEALTPLADGYRAWLKDRKAEAATLPEPWHKTADRAVFLAESIADRIAAGISLLTEPSQSSTHDQAQALAAFRFANRTMALQRRHTALSALRDADESLTYSDALAIVEKRGPGAASWRPFQLAFVLLNLPALTIPTHPERAADASAHVDLLFFPTGGGKTEAYLGLAAYTFAIRRLQGEIGSGETARSGESGVAVLMRYTLRLLTAQQFQRAAALVCAAEVLRREDPQTWGATPFRIGLWVGAGVSPNWYDEAEKEIAQAKESGRREQIKVLQTLSCPWCGQKLIGHDDLVPDSETRRILLYCGNAEGLDICPFSYPKSPGEGLPILTVDEEIYRYLPALVIATVDKLAQLPWRGFPGMLFGRVHRRCPRHGYCHEDLDSRTGCTDKHHKTSTRPAVVTEPVTRLRPPDLIIQDELHLISGALGTTVGLFEAAVDELCTWQAPRADGSPGLAEVGPKIVASTATTKRAHDQVRRLFARKLSIFPPQVLDVADTFFSHQEPISPKHPGRRYLGLCAHGVRMKAAEIRLAEILLIGGQTLFDKYGKPADPYMTVVGYFNATRELAGMRRLLDDDVSTRVAMNGHRRGLSDRLTGVRRNLTIAELTSRISSADITASLKLLEAEFSVELDTSTRLDAIRTAYAAAAKDNRFSELTPPLPQRNVPVDIVLATSMLQVGVDVSRFGLMVVTGQPKNTAEYIQASSRVGRDDERPGLVVTLYNWSRPRDMAHFENFEHYHATFYRQVEALSVTPYARRSLDRGTAATYVAAMRNVVEQNSRNWDAQDVDLDGPLADRVRQRFLARAYAADGNRGRAYFAERIDAFRDQWKQLRTGSTARLGYADGKYQKQPLRPLLEKASGSWTARTVGMSMRETENEINLLVTGSEGGLFAPDLGAPAWTFAGSEAEGDGVPEAPEPDADEFGGLDTAGEAERR